ncbi:MAG: hypothetical protein L0226_13765 [Acidobacteria bacterium]|nr:hypothetical protein [Acidobacteriota bacterium]
MIGYLSLRLIAVVSVIVSGALDKPLGVGVPLAVIAFYLLLAWRTNKEDATELESHADDVYFIGYLSTIAAFAGVILHIWIIGKVQSDPRPILLMVGVALMTTVAGLVAMTILKDLARRVRRDYPLLELEQKERVIKIDGAQVVSEVKRGLIDIINKASESIDELNNQLGLLKTNVDTLKGNVDQGADSAQQFATNIRQLQNVLDEFVILLKGKLDLESERIEDLKQIRTTLDEFTSLLHRFSQVYSASIDTLHNADGWVDSKITTINKTAVVRIPDLKHESEVKRG